MSFHLSSNLPLHLTSRSIQPDIACNLHCRICVPLHILRRFIRGGMSDREPKRRAKLRVLTIFCQLHLSYLFPHRRNRSKTRQGVLRPDSARKSPSASSGGRKPAVGVLTVTDLEVLSAFLLPVLQETIQGASFLCFCFPSYHATLFSVPLCSFFLRSTNVFKNVIDV